MKQNELWSKRMEPTAKTWWGKRFMEALQQFVEDDRLKKGLAFSKPERLLSFERDINHMKASVLGKTNKTLGIMTEEPYSVKIEMGLIAKPDWELLIEQLAANAAWITQFLLDEVPDGIQEIFNEQGFPLLPESWDDFRTACSCPAPENPCQHSAGVFFHIASLLDRDPFLLFEMRGLSRQELQAALQRSPLGKALASQLAEEPLMNIQPARQRYSQPTLQPLNRPLSLKEFWGTPTTLPQEPAISAYTGVPALLIKKQGDYPQFWKRNNSFIHTLENIYAVIRQHSR